MRYRFPVCWSLALLPFLLLGGCSFFGEQEDVTKDWSASKLYAEASAELSGGGYENAIKYYEKLEARYPFGRYAMQAQLDVAYAYYKADKPEEAIAAADRFIKLYPQSPFVDYAYYFKGIVNYNRSVDFLDRFIPTDRSQRDPGSALEAFNDFAEVVKRFPDSKYAADARQRMLYLRGNLARNEVNIAKFYVKQGAYLAAVDRCNHVIQHYQRTSAVRDALVTMIDAYKKLGKDDLATDAQRVLDLNDKEGKFVSDAEAPEEISLTRKVWDYLELDKN
ncbi:MAG: outer membrane protein assembly factor BamD [Gammaproteobacteria bacterium]|jgi:outer membrane protein assembly factor BamD|nr:outer membrane protein assembly factor BamD [Gammaproteobacteria bacterium]